jgi:hypothetical protein
LFLLSFAPPPTAFAHLLIFKTITDAKDAIPKLRFALERLDNIQFAMQEVVTLNGVKKTLLQCLPVKLQETFKVVHNEIKQAITDSERHADAAAPTVDKANLSPRNNPNVDASSTNIPRDVKLEAVSGNSPPSLRYVENDLKSISLPFIHVFHITRLVLSLSVFSRLVPHPFRLFFVTLPPPFPTEWILTEK